MNNLGRASKEIPNQDTHNTNETKLKFNVGGDTTRYVIKTKHIITVILVNIKFLFPFICLL